MTSKLFFTADGAGEHPGPTYFRDFAPMPLGKFMVLLYAYKNAWNALECLLVSLFSLPPPSF